MQQSCVTSKCDSILDKIVQTILPFRLVDFLNTRIIRNRYVDINLWSFVHIFSGAIFFILWKEYSKNYVKGFWVWLLIHCVWETIEFLLALKGLYPALFFEEYVDIFWDTVVSQLGYATLWLIFKDKPEKKAT